MTRKGPACEVWGDHEWVTGRLIETGRHPARGRYEKFACRCARCGSETVETRWTDLSGALRPDERSFKDS